MFPFSTFQINAADAVVPARLFVQRIALYAAGISENAYKINYEKGKRTMKKEITINGRVYPMKKSKFCINESPVHVSDSMSGKMAGIPSISTSCLLNTICQKRMQDGSSICAHCFAETTLNRYKEAGQAMERNYYLLTEAVLPLEFLPVFANVAIVRIESFGDVQNVTQAINYANICKVNPSVMFAWWTKNAAIVKKAFDMVGKPENVIMIESSEKLNCKKELSNGYMDKVFTVYDAKTIAEKAIDINCGARCCATCRNCYKKDSAAIVSEKLK